MSQCSAHRKGGGECRAQAVSGTNVCRVHGGNAPQVRRRAAQRLLEASDTAAAYLVKTIEDATLPPETRLKASLALLDRAGLGVKATVDVEVGPKQEEKAPWENLVTRIYHKMPQQPVDVGELKVIPPSAADTDAAGRTAGAAPRQPDPEPPNRWEERVDGPRPRQARRRT